MKRLLSKLGLLLTCGLLAAFSMPKPEMQQREETQQVVVVVSSPRTDWVTVGEQVELARFYGWVSQQKPAREGTTRAQARQESGITGDRFDRLAMCESGMRQDAVGGGGRYLSYFQWSLSTWHAAGGEGDPRDVDYGTQKAIAMSWAERANPAGQWPVCWARSA